VRRLRLGEEKKKKDRKKIETTAAKYNVLRAAITNKLFKLKKNLCDMLTVDIVYRVKTSKIATMLLFMNISIFLVSLATT